MTITQVFITLITTISPPSGGTIMDRCDIVDTATGVPLWCRAHPEGAPVFDGDVCCNAAGCVPAATGCSPNSLYYCELGQIRADGMVECYFEVPNYCDVFPCSPTFQTAPLEYLMCCYEGICWHHAAGADDCEAQDIFWCNDGVTNVDGTVTCFD